MAAFSVPNWASSISTHHTSATASSASRLGSTRPNSWQAYEYLLDSLAVDSKSRKVISQIKDMELFEAKDFDDWVPVQQNALEWLNLAKKEFKDYKNIKNVERLGFSKFKTMYKDFIKNTENIFLAEPSKDEYVKAMLLEMAYNVVERSLRRSRGRSSKMSQLEYKILLGGGLLLGKGKESDGSLYILFNYPSDIVMSKLLGEETTYEPARTGFAQGVATTYSGTGTYNVTSGTI